MLFYKIILFFYLQHYVIPVFYFSNKIIKIEKKESHTKNSSDL